MATDATPAYRGYRLQHLYTLWCILNASNQEDGVFQLEGQEDLDIINSSNRLLDVRQVKAYNDDLVLSMFSPEKPDSFFYRFASLLKGLPNLRGSIVSFGPIGPELLRALSENGADRRNVARKLSSYKYLSEDETLRILTSIRLLSVEEADLTEKVFALLRQSLMGFDPEAAFDLLSFWLYRCAEQKRRLTRQDVIEKANSVGRFLAERAAHHREWFTSIVPIEDFSVGSKKEQLAHAFFRGVSVKYEHILADLDVQRPQKLQEIARKFTSHSVVIIHGASGQGKSTLAYRYLREYFPNLWRFQIRVVDGREHALSIARALSGHADALEVPLVIYVDVSPRDSGWLDLVEQLVHHPSIQILITIREEDFRRVMLSRADVEVETVKLTLEYSEAEQLYYRLQEKQLSGRFLTFRDAWNQFGNNGPLMEFVYLITQGELLRERLREQVIRLQDDILASRYPPAMLDILRLVSVASAYEAQLHVTPLIQSMRLLVPERILELLEGEYLLKRNEDGSLLQGLHPVRSAILVELLTDPPAAVTWLESACTCVPFLYEPDIESFLLYSFSRHQTEQKALLAFLAAYQTNQWTALAGIMRALLWLGIRNYAEANRPLIQEVVEQSGPGWYLVLDSDLAGATQGSVYSLWENLGNHLSPSGKQQIQHFQARQSDKKDAFALVKTWLSRQNLTPLPPKSEGDWAAMAETLFWIGHLQIDWPLEEWLEQLDLETALHMLPLDVGARIVLGIWRGYENKIPSWLGIYRELLLHRFQDETSTVAVDDDETELIASFLIPWTLLESASLQEKEPADWLAERLHIETMQRISFLRQIFPDRDTYTCRGYGHKLSESSDINDSTYKNISHTNLPFRYLTEINALFRGNARYSMRPTTWQEYTQRVLDLRRAIIKVLQELEQGLVIYFRKQQPTSLFDTAITVSHWEHCQQLLRNPPLLPQCAVDEWGFVDEMLSSDEGEKSGKEFSFQQERRGIVLQEYSVFLRTFQQYLRTLSNFLSQGQSMLVIQINSALAKSANNERERLKIAAQRVSDGMNPDVFRVSAINLGDAGQVIEALQREFQRLLANFCLPTEQKELDRQERLIFSRLWNIWYFFVYHPELVLQDALQEYCRRIESKQQKAQKDIQQMLRLLSQEGISAQIINDKHEWNRKPTLWIMVDAKSPLEAYNAGERIIAILYRATHKTKEMLLRRYALNFPFTNVIIIPLVRGKSLTAQVWRAFLPGLLVSDNKGDLTPLSVQKISSRVLIALGIETWEIPELEDAKQLWEKTVELSLLTAHLRDLKRLPYNDNVRVIERIRPYIDQIATHLGNALQTILDREVTLNTLWSNISSREYTTQPTSEQMQQLLQEFHRGILSTIKLQNETTGRIEMRLDEIAEWASRLEQMRVYAFLIYLLVATDTLNRSLG